MKDLLIGGELALVCFYFHENVNSADANHNIGTTTADGAKIEYNVGTKNGLQSFDDWVLIGVNFRCISH